MFPFNHLQIPKYIILLLLGLASIFGGEAVAERKVLHIGPAQGIYNLADYAESVQKSDTVVDFSRLHLLSSVPLAVADLEGSTHWLKFVLANDDSLDHKLYLSIAFSDYNSLFIAERNTIFKQSGDLVPLKGRKVKTGQFCFIPIEIRKGEELTCFLKLESASTISQQFKRFTLDSLKIYTEHAYLERFEKPRTFHAFFFGAVLIMLVFNFFIFISTRSLSYFYYVCFLGLLALFLAANSGYVLELFLSDFPRVDLYVRFLSAPLLVVSYLLFSINFLDARKYTPVLKKILSGCIVLFLFYITLMVLGYWKIGRAAVILTSILSFLLIFYTAYRIYRKGYSPAAYFLGGNLLLIAGGLIYAAERLFIIPQNLIGGYNLQVSSLLEIVLFSFGLADRINFIQKELNEVRFENERKSKESEIERKRIVEEKNRELEIVNKQLDAFIYRTAHDLRGPLARVLGMSQLALMDIKEEAARDYFSRITADANQLSYILKRLSVIYEISTKKIVIDPINAIELVSSILQDFASQGYYIDSDIKTEIFSETIYSDRLLVRFILQNLLENAFKFKEEKGKQKIEILIQKDSRSIIIQVKDFGIGIPVNEVSSLFELFSTAALKYKTPGLGLYMVRICAEKLSGKVVLENPSNPTVFRVELPA